jgi:hypothetical protein
MNLTHHERAARGAALLESRNPGSVARLDEATLNINSNVNCALGQIYGGYSDGIRELFGREVIPGGISSYGFNGISGDDIAELTESWRRIVLAAKKPAFESTRELVAA